MSGRDVAGNVAIRAGLSGTAYRHLYGRTLIVGHDAFVGWLKNLRVEDAFIWWNAGREVCSR